jgi:hypothetical protein
MDTFTEVTHVDLSPDGFASLSVERTYDDGIGYRARLYFQTADLRAVSDALERFSRSSCDEVVTLADGILRIFSLPPSPMVNVELERDAALAHGGYDTLDLGPESVATVVAALRA